MRYTRYEYKKSGRMKFLCSVVVIVGISIVGGVLISNVVFDGKSVQNVGINSSKASTQGDYNGAIKISSHCNVAIIQKRRMQKSHYLQYQNTVSHL